MKAKFNTIQDALVYQLQGLLYAENKVRDQFNTCESEISSDQLKTELDKYTDQAGEKTLKLQRAFNYLMQDPQKQKNEVINKLIKETRHMLGYAIDIHLKDVLLVTCFQNINAYKTATYRTAYLFAVELGLDTVADLLQQILEWEVETGKTLNSLSIHEFNRINIAIE